MVLLAGDLESWLTASWQARGLRLGYCIAAGAGAYALALAVTGLRPRHLAAPARTAETGS